MKRSTFLSLATVVVFAALFANASADDTAAQAGRTYRVGVEGMSCPISCAPKVKQALESIDGVQSVEVSFADKLATVTMAPGKTLTAEACDHAFGNQGYFVSDIAEAPAADPGS